MNGFGIILVIGIGIGILISGICLIALHTDGKLMEKYDEMQNLARGKAFSFAFYTMGIMNLVFAVLYAFELNLPFDTTFGFFLSLLCGAFVYALISVWKDAYVGLNSKAKNTRMWLAVIAGSNLMLGLLAMIGGVMFTDGKVHFQFFNLLCGLMIVAVIIEIIIKDRKNQEEED